MIQILEKKENKKKWTWKCPLDNCHSKGTSPTTKKEAWKYGLQHLRLAHHLLMKDGYYPKIVNIDDVKQISTKNRKAIWVCPIDGCKAHGKKPVSKSKAVKFGREHLHRMHGVREDPIIVEKWRNDMNQKNNQNIKKDLFHKASKEHDIVLV